MKHIDEQKLVCQKFGAPFLESPMNFKIGISENVKLGVWPINGLRHPVQGDMTGWYIWAGEYSTDKDFFKPLHVSHLEEIHPTLLMYLGLAPGWRFLLAENYEDAWEDLSLLDV